MEFTPAELTLGTAAAGMLGVLIKKYGVDIIGAALKNGRNGNGKGYLTKAEHDAGCALIKKDITVIQDDTGEIKSEVKGLRADVESMARGIHGRIDQLFQRP